jgi:hypothetical protein
MKRHVTVTLDSENIEAFHFELGRKNLSGFLNEVLRGVVENARKQAQLLKCEKCEVIWSRFAWEKHDWVCNNCGTKNTLKQMKTTTQKLIRAEGGGGMRV